MCRGGESPTQGEIPRQFFEKKQEITITMIIITIMRIIITIMLPAVQKIKAM